MSISNKRPTLGNNINRKTGGLLDRTSRRSRDLLDDESVTTPASIEMQKTSNDQTMDFSCFRVHVNRYEYPRLGKVPAICYYSRIAGMAVREKNGKAILDVNYDLKDSYGREYRIMQSYPADSEPYRRFADALAAAGVPEDSFANAGIGVEEIIELDYLSKTHDLGSIVNRRPYDEANAQEADDEDNDILLDEDD